MVVFRQIISYKAMYFHFIHLGQSQQKRKAQFGKEVELVRIILCCRGTRAVSNLDIGEDSSECVAREHGRAWHGMAWNGMAEIKAAIPELLPSFLPPLAFGWSCHAMPIWLRGSRQRSQSLSGGRGGRSTREGGKERERDSARIRRHFAIIEMFRLRLLLFPSRRSR